VEPLAEVLLFARKTAGRTSEEIDVPAVELAQEGAGAISFGDVESLRGVSRRAEEADQRRVGRGRLGEEPGHEVIGADLRERGLEGGGGVAVGRNGLVRQAEPLED
jgi:hypothetical protein